MATLATTKRAAAHHAGARPQDYSPAEILLRRVPAQSGQRRPAEHQRRKESLDGQSPDEN